MHHHHHTPYGVRSYTNTTQRPLLDLHTRPSLDAFDGVPPREAFDPPNDPTGSIDRSIECCVECIAIDSRVVTRVRVAMDQALAALTRAQEDLRSSLAVGLQEIRAAADAATREHAGETKRAREERETHRRAIETQEAEGKRLEGKLLQCEEALKETKNALLETRDAAKDVRAGDGDSNAGAAIVGTRDGWMRALDEKWFLKALRS